MEKATIEILGHIATIGSVSGRLPDRWHKEDHLEVWFEFDKAVYSILSFGIELPVKNYGRQEFLEAACKEGERELKRRLDIDVQRESVSKDRGRRQKDLDSLASQIESRLTSSA